MKGFFSVILVSFMLKTNAMNIQTATFASGCFWCTEAIFQEVKGVLKVKSGYMGGKVANPTYEEVCKGTTGHAEVIQVEFDAEIIRYEELLEIFWKTHDPTTLNKQGADIGTQYRSEIFYHSAAQKPLAEAYKNKLEAAKIWDKPIVTAISAAQIFYEAEKYHQDYYQLNASKNTYCSYVITPKLEKFRAIFKEKLKN